MKLHEVSAGHLEEREKMETENKRRQAALSELCGILILHYVNMHRAACIHGHLDSA